jgi:hypothetical protein
MRTADVGREAAACSDTAGGEIAHASDETAHAGAGVDPRADAAVGDVTHAGDDAGTADSETAHAGDDTDPGEAAAAGEAARQYDSFRGPVSTSEWGSDEAVSLPTGTVPPAACDLNTHAGNDTAATAPGSTTGQYSDADLARALDDAQLLDAKSDAAATDRICTSDAALAASLSTDDSSDPSGDAALAASLQAEDTADLSDRSALRPQGRAPAQPARAPYTGPPPFPPRSAHWLGPTSHPRARTPGQHPRGVVPRKDGAGIREHPRGSSPPRTLGSAGSTVASTHRRATTSTANAGRNHAIAAAGNTASPAKVFTLDKKFTDSGMMSNRTTHHWRKKMNNAFH